MNSAPRERILLVDPEDLRRGMLARRLEAQGYEVEQAVGGAEGAEMALSNPPAAVVSDLWMPSISGVQLSRLLSSEPATMDVPVILCADNDEPRNRFWAERAGAVRCVVKGRTGELMRTLAQVLMDRHSSHDFFVQLSGGTVDIRDRIARHLDAALFDSVVAGEIRALSSAGTFERLFDKLAQLLSQVVRYRWMALSTTQPERMAIHHHPGAGATAREEAKAALGARADIAVVAIEDEDARDEAPSETMEVRPISFGGVLVGRLAISVCEGGQYEGSPISELVARELGGPLKMTWLIEESQRLATVDPLTGLQNRRAFTAAVKGEIARCQRYGHKLSVALVDVDFFKRINDTHGHCGGDRVLTALGQLLHQTLRASDYAARWGGEEFVVAYASTDVDGALTAAERLREAIERLDIRGENGEPIGVTASLGLAELEPGEGLDELLDRADHAMYESKAAGRNRTTPARRWLGPPSSTARVA